ncbi:hypothetical protein IV102_21860 [bacterium]|nr:hypothetical protein [bacterium]
MMLLVVALATGVFPQVSREEALRLYDSSLRLYQAAVKAGTPESYKLAREEARQSTVADPSLAKAWALKGHILKQSPGGPEQQRAYREVALKDYDKAISIDSPKRGLAEAIFNVISPQR